MSAVEEFKATDYSHYEHPEEVAQEALAAIAELEAERDHLRETNRRLNRRAQLAEGAANERLKDGPRGFGQLLTLLRCRQLEAELEEIRALVSSHAFPDIHMINVLAILAKHDAEVQP